MCWRYELDMGKELVVNHAYRSWMHQLGVKMLLPKLAAWPWESAHVRGVAVDLNVRGFDSDTYLWLYNNAGRFGWTQPDWAQECGWNPEPWHWEFVGRKP
jgi:LAS superfamily LD-carboxypeptidase LdcB